MIETQKKMFESRIEEQNKKIDHFQAKFVQYEKDL